MSRADAKRTVNRLMNLLPTDVLEEITEGIVIPSHRVTVDDRVMASRLHGGQASPVGIAAARQRQEAAWLVHEAATALPIDSLLVQTAGSGIAETDAVVLVGNVMDAAVVQAMRRRPLTPRERMRRQWDQKRRRLTVLPDSCHRVCRSRFLRTWWVIP